MVKRRSHFIRREQASYTLPAILTACEIGKPLNTFVSINFRHLECSEDEAGTLNDSLRRWASGWLRRPSKNQLHESTQLTLMWVIENCGDVGVHWAIHIPKGSNELFVEALLKKLKLMFGDKVVSNTLLVKPIKRILGLRKYFLKGLQDTYGPLYRIQTSPQGLVIGKRFGVSQNIGPSSITRLGIKENRTFLLKKYFPNLNVAS